MSDRMISKGRRSGTRIIACAVFKPALEHIQLLKRYPNLRVSYLPSNLHLSPQKLENYLRREVALARRRNESVVCLYGDCFPTINDFCKEHEVIKVPGPHCDEMLLGSQPFRQIIEETAGTYFLEQELILNFEKYCVKPLELDDAEMRKAYFEHYRRVLYVHQPSDPDLTPKAIEVARFLELPLEIREADYSHLDRTLIDLIQQALSR